MQWRLIWTFKMECKFCNINEDHLIKKFNHWNVFIHNQCYLGRCAVALNRHIEDLTEITLEEREELFNILKKLRESIISLFGANLFTYTSAGNITRHLHVHFIPRYDHNLEFEGVLFKDERWGKNHATYNRRFKVSGELLNKIKEKIGSKI